MKAPICWAMVQKIASEAITRAERPELGHGDVAESPMAVPNVRRTKESAEARTAPARIAPHSRKLGTAFEDTSPGAMAARAGPTCVMELPSRSQCSAEAEEAQDEHDHDDQPNQVNDAVHGLFSSGTTLCVLISTTLLWARRSGQGDEQNREPSTN